MTRRGLFGLVIGLVAGRKAKAAVGAVAVGKIFYVSPPRTLASAFEQARPGDTIYLFNGAHVGDKLKQ